MKPVFQMKTFYDNRHERPRWRQMPVHDSWLTVNIVLDPTENASPCDETNMSPGKQNESLSFHFPLLSVFEMSG